MAMGVPKMDGLQGKPIKMRMMTGGTRILGNPHMCDGLRRSKHGIDSVVISLGGIAPQGPLSLHTVGAHFC